MLRKFLLYSLIALSNGKIVEYDWAATWVYANPDGLHWRPVIGINHQWPCPTIKATKGDRVIIRLRNELGNQTTSLHFHGIHQRNSSAMDGASMVTQCPIPPGSLFTYNFVV